MQINPYLNFSGNCKEAFQLYERVLGGKIEFVMTNGESPMKDQTPEGWQDKIMHVSTRAGDTVLMGSDAPPQYYTAPTTGMRVVISTETDAEAERIFAALSEGGTVAMPIEETFFASRFGMCTDRYGVPWMVSCMKRMAEPTSPA